MSAARYNLIMLIVLVLGGAFIFLRPAPDSATATAAMADLDPATVTRIRVDRPGRPPLLLRREDGRWWLEGAFAGPANAQRAEALAAFPASAPAEALALEPGASLIPFGLDPPRALLTVEGLEFVIGETHPMDGRRYVLWQGRVYLVAEQIYHQLLTEPADFVDPRPITRPGALVGLALPERRLRREDETWLDDEGRDAGELAQRWLRARAITVRAAGDAIQTQASVVLRYSDGPERRLGIVQREPLLVLHDAERGLNYEFAGSAGNALLGN